MFEDIFRRKKAIAKKLDIYGFQKIKTAYKYNVDILNGEFRLDVTVGKNPVPDTKLTEISTGEEYVLYKTNAVGKYIGEVKSAVAGVLQDIADRCFETAIFKAEQSIALISYVREKYGDEPEYLWDKSPNNAIWRRQDSKKWYGVLLTVSRRKLGFPSDEIVEIIDLRSEPDKLESLIDNEHYLSGWHMNKKHWYTIVLDGSVPTDEICRRVNDSYMLAK